jgi:hypothetical protein
MLVESRVRQIPYTYNRMATELVQGKRDLDRARKELRLALEILRTLDEDPIRVPVAALEEVLMQVEEAAIALRTRIAGPMSPTPVGQG